jgi:hypothetical protein
MEIVQANYAVWQQLDLNVRMRQTDQLVTFLAESEMESNQRAPNLYHERSFNTSRKLQRRGCWR